VPSRTEYGLSRGLCSSLLMRDAQHPDRSPRKSAAPLRRSIGAIKTYSGMLLALSGLKKESAETRKNRAIAAGSKARSGLPNAAAPVAVMSGIESTSNFSPCGVYESLNTFCGCFL